MTKQIPLPAIPVDQQLEIDRTNIEGIIKELKEGTEAAKKSTLSKDLEISLIEIKVNYLEKHWLRYIENIDRILSK